MAPPEDPNGKNGGDGDATSKTTNIVLKKNIPYLKVSTTGGVREGVTVQYWVYILEKHFEEEGLTGDAEKITKANMFIEFQEGEARDIAHFSGHCETWNQFKSHMLDWLESDKPDELKDMHDFMHLQWDRKTTNFCQFMKAVGNGIVRINSNYLPGPENQALMYRLGQANIVSQLPEKTRRKFLEKKDTKVKDWKTYCQFVSDVNGALREDPEYKKTIERPIGAINKYQNNQNTNNQPNTSGNQHYSSSGFQQNRKPQNYQNQSYNQNKTSHQQGGERRLSRYEQKYDVCGR